MSLIVEISFARIDKRLARRVVEEVRTKTGLGFGLQGHWFRRTCNSLLTWGVNGMQALNADWDDPICHLDPTKVSPLIAALEIVVLKIGAPFDIVFVWVSDPVTREETIGWSALKRMIEAGEVGQRCLYHVFDDKTAARRRVFETLDRSYDSGEPGNILGSHIEHQP